MTVKPKGDESLKPSLYVLRPTPPKSSDHEAMTSAACLATHYFSNNYNLTMTIGDVSEQRSIEDALVSIQHRTYSLISFLTAPWSQIMKGITCELHPPVEINNAQDDNPEFCLPLEEIDEDGQRERGLSLTVFGLRILFFKSVVFNVLMSVRVWIS